MKFYVYDFSTNKKIAEIEIDTENSIVPTLKILKTLGIEKPEDYYLNPDDTFEYNGETYYTKYLSYKPELKASALENKKTISRLFRKELVELDCYGNVISSKKVELDKNGLVNSEINKGE